MSILHDTRRTPALSAPRTSNQSPSHRRRREQTTVAELVAAFAARYRHTRTCPVRTPDDDCPHALPTDHVMHAYTTAPHDALALAGGER